MLAGALLWQHATRGRAPALTQAATASPTPGAAPPAGPSIRIQSRSVTGELTLRLAQRVQTPDGGSALGLIVHVRLASGTETLTPDSFVTAGPDGAPTPAGSVTMLVPGAPLASAEDGFAVTAPATVDVQVILGVPPGDHLVYLVNGETGETLAWFAASG